MTDIHAPCERHEKDTTKKVDGAELSCDPEAWKFFSLYANVKLPDREMPFPDGTGRTLEWIYHEVKKEEDEIRPKRLRQSRLIETAKEFLKSRTDGK